MGLSAKIPCGVTSGRDPGRLEFHMCAGIRSQARYDRKLLDIQLEQFITYSISFRFILAYSCHLNITKFHTPSSIRLTFPYDYSAAVY